ncbi:MAG: two-component system sensor histidine kinase NtrB [Candidatus Sedimenticola endophacoides]|uniref:Sensory histidine kinase/phosphatase NtrB n=1 Tax=Candidatus Sedimenticola endophacoides TaxID=2548426 RepID=A0A6N4DT16_9GAMM|nr:MAG: two-component system sensor histidine kinase NtrB [Candidatus Sedimenticola endophacoides]OQX33226.1 MAG: two-component system sensor histidine kinase NtrB [Candidatus Sedimenticola endophacoides]OQX38710.1 MAG: two-component system sensor histidine kinase NtrB [Candidatus Sedimenticola endophacoides]OQX48317.1 MAG: two-component system sensor histidine kinase NtrB [Candidatus Sedimenticola endophacoides]PUD99036.1 MAG: nitrogen regulation protein NR(II) [Candidatus Sedimenticola endoph
MTTSDTILDSDARRVLENLNTAALLFDADLNLRYMNPAAEMLFAVSAKHMIGLPAERLLQCPAGSGNHNLNRALASGHPFTEREVSLPRADATQVTVDCTLIPLTDREGEGGLLVELQQIDRQLRISREEHLLSQHQAARELIRGLAHEIKNPLGGLRGAAQLLESELPDPALTEYTRVIIDEADRLQELVNRMLGPNKLLEPREVNIHVLLERVRSLVAAEFGTRLCLVRDYDPSIPELHADSDRLIQALLNILRNAARAVGEQEAGRVVLRTRILRQFTIGTRRHRLVVEVGIEDNGPGIPETIREKLFYPMVTASAGGVGLGLSIAQSLINQHGGLIECESEPGRTLFNVLLPLENHDVTS